MTKGAQPGDQMRLGKFLPVLTCVNCGKTAGSSSFPKRGGLTYEKLKPSNPRLYDKQCKQCKKAAKPGQPRSEVTAPKMKTGPRKKKKKRKPVRQRPNRHKKESNIVWRAKVRKETRIKSMLYLTERGCEECNERDPRKLEYDHKDRDDKKHKISGLITQGYSWSSSVLRSEIRKCRVLCANCHRKHTIVSQGYYADDAVKQVLRDLAEAHGFHV